MWADFDHGFSLQMTRTQAESASHPGPCDDEVKALLSLPAIKRQLDKISPDAIRAELKEWGAWDDTELADDQQNRARLVWIAAGNIREDIRERS